MTLQRLLLMYLASFIQSIIGGFWFHIRLFQAFMVQSEASFFMLLFGIIWVLFLSAVLWCLSTVHSEMQGFLVIIARFLIDRLTVTPFNFHSDGQSWPFEWTVDRQTTDSKPDQKQHLILGIGNQILQSLPCQFTPHLFIVNAKVTSLIIIFTVFDSVIITAITGFTDFSI